MTPQERDEFLAAGWALICSSELIIRNAKAGFYRPFIAWNMSSFGPRIPALFGNSDSILYHAAACVWTEAYIEGGKPMVFADPFMEMKR